MKSSIKFLVLLLLVLLICFLNYKFAEQNLQLGNISDRDFPKSADSVVKGVISDVNEESRGNIKRRRKKILIYTSLFGSLPWGYVPYDYNFTNFDGTLCPVSDCEATYNKSELSSSDLVVFYGRDLPSIEHMKTISRTERSLNQQWVFYMHESPIYSYFNAPSLNGIFNLTASYRSDSDILVTYWFYEPLRDEDPRPNLNHNFAEGRKKVITWINSHCDDDRVAFVQKLREFINLDVYGACSRKFDPNLTNCPRGSKNCKDIQSQYKFFLAIENSFCIDYITEKYWLNGLDAGLVPVVLGFGDYKNNRLAIPGSYIDARDFASIKDLSRYLLYLNSNDKAYNTYHQWRYKYKLRNYNFMCIFCDAIQNYNIPPKTVDLGKFWGMQTCDSTKQPLKHLIATAGNSNHPKA